MPEHSVGLLRCVTHHPGCWRNMYQTIQTSYCLALKQCCWISVAGCHFSLTEQLGETCTSISMDNNVGIFPFISVLQGDDLEEGGQPQKFRPKRQIEKQACVLLERDLLLRLLSTVSPREPLVSAPAVMMLRFFLSSTSTRSAQLLSFFIAWYAILGTRMVKGEFDNNLHLSEWYMYQEGKAIVSASERSATRKN